MSKNLYALPFLAVLALACTTGTAQNDGPPRRLDDPDTIRLPGGGRVEFHEFSSESLGEQGRYSIFLPPSYASEPERTFPVIFFLHGMNNDHTSWAVDRYGDLPPTVEKLILDGHLPAFLMIHPQGQNSFYTDTLDGRKKSEQYIYRDLIREIEQKFRVRTDAAGRAISGTSMGGYGALKIALKHPDLFGTVAAGSPIILLGEDPSKQIDSSNSERAQRFGGLFQPLFGIPFDQKHWRDNSVEALARSRSFEDLSIYFVYGTADRYQNLFPMEQGIRTLDEILTERGIAHTLRVYEGEPHGWELIEGHLPEILKFLTQKF